MLAHPPADALLSRTRPHPAELRHFGLFAVVAVLELVLSTYLLDSPRLGLPTLLEPVNYGNAIAKIGALGFVLLMLAAWPRRAELVVAYRAVTARSATALYSLAANLGFFVLLLAVGLSIQEADRPSLPAVSGYVALLLATGVSLAFVAAPPAFWLRLLTLAPVEIAVALTGASVALGLGQFAIAGWDELAGVTLQVSHWILELYEPGVILDTEKRLLGIGDFSVVIYGPCSGYEGISLVLTALPIYLWIFRRELRFPNALLLVPLGVAAIWLFNALRIALLVSLGAHLSPDIAVQGFHSQAGWVGFLCVTLGCIALSRKVAFFSAAGRSLHEPARGDDGAAAESATDRRADGSLAYLAPFMAMLAANILAAAFSPHDQWLYAVKVIAIAGALWWFRGSYMPLVAGASWRAVAAGLAVGVAWIATDPGRGEATALGLWIAALPAGAAALWLSLRALGSVALVPIAEELAFRGFLARWLVSTRFESVGFGEFRALGFFGSSVAFGLMHQRWLAAFLAGAVYALLMYRSRRLSDPIVAHAVTNGAIMGWAVAAGQWSLL